MAFVDRFAAGYHVGKASLRLLRRRPSLFVFSTLAILGVVGVTVAGFALSHYVFGDWRAPLKPFVYPTVYPERLPLVFLAAAAYSGVVTAWNAALVGSVMRMLDGDGAPLRGGLRDAWDARWRILLWALVSGAVGVLLRVVDRRDGGFSVGRLVLGAAWAFLTYFVVPVMVVERIGGLEMFRRSKDLVKELWAESAAAYVGVATAFWSLGLLVLAVGIVFPEVVAEFVIPDRDGVVLLTLGIESVLATIGLAATSVTKVLLFDVATDGDDPTDPSAYERRVDAVR